MLSSVPPALLGLRSRAGRHSEMAVVAAVFGMLCGVGQVLLRQDLVSTTEQGHIGNPRHPAHASRATQFAHFHSNSKLEIHHGV